MPVTIAKSVSCAVAVVLAAGWSLGAASAEMVRSRTYAPGHNVRAAARHNAKQPGVTKYISPNSRQTGTGGPVGGLPGRS